MNANSFQLRRPPDDIAAPAEAEAAGQGEAQVPEAGDGGVAEKVGGLRGRPQVGLHQLDPPRVTHAALGHLQDQQER